MKPKMKDEFSSLEFVKELKGCVLHNDENHILILLRENGNPIEIQANKDWFQTSEKPKFGNPIIFQLFKNENSVKIRIIDGEPEFDKSVVDEISNLLKDI